MVSGPAGAERPGRKQQTYKFKVLCISGGSRDQVVIEVWKFCWVWRCFSLLEEKGYSKIEGFRDRTSKTGHMMCTGVGRLRLSVRTTARLRAAELMDGANRKQQAQTSTRRKILPRPNAERTGANRKKNKREIWHLPKCHPIKPAAQSGEQGSSRHRQAPESE